jgi:23S rRNA (pseudouridine1915-N3)-methyltransferase
MRVRLLAIGNKEQKWVEEGFHTYAKRFPPSYPFEFVEIPAEKRSKQSDISRIIEVEGTKLLNAVKPNHCLIALDVKGEAWSTEVLAEKLKRLQTSGKSLDLLIGGPDGLSAACLKKADLRWSLSPLTFPHPLVKIIVVEQLYRAISILQNHPYHRK